MVFCNSPSFDKRFRTCHPLIVTCTLFSNEKGHFRFGVNIILVCHHNLFAVIFAFAFNFDLNTAIRIPQLYACARDGMSILYRPLVSTRCRNALLTRHRQRIQMLGVGSIKYIHIHSVDITPNGRIFGYRHSVIYSCSEIWVNFLRSTTTFPLCAAASTTADISHTSIPTPN